MAGTAATRAKNKYNKANYYRLELRLPIEDKEKLKAIAEAEGVELGTYARLALYEKLEREGKTLD